MSSDEFSDVEMNNQSYSKNWTHRLEDTAKRIADSCVDYRNMHRIMSRKHDYINNILMIINTGVGIAIAIIIFVTSYYETNKILSTIAGVVTLALVISERISSYLNLTSSSKDHQDTSIKWNSLYNTIEIQLGLEIHKRHEAIFYLEAIQTRFNNLMEISPKISNRVWDNYMARRVNEKEINKRKEKKSKERDLEKGERSKEEKMITYESNKIKYEIERHVQDM
jgi:hypothetical protein